MDENMDLENDKYNVWIINSSLNESVSVAVSEIKSEQDKVLDFSFLSGKLNNLEKLLKKENESMQLTPEDRKRVFNYGCIKK